MLTLALSLTLAASSPDFDAAASDLRALLSQLLAVDTTNPPGNEARAVALAAERLRLAGIPFEVVDFAPGRQNLVARLKGTGPDKPVLIYGHTDVVGTDNQTWTSPPHVLTETGAYLVGRGSSDDLGPVATSLEAFVLLQRSGVPLRRDVILA